MSTKNSSIAAIATTLALTVLCVAVYQFTGKSTDTPPVKGPNSFSTNTASSKPNNTATSHLEPDSKGNHETALGRAASETKKPSLGDLLARGPTQLKPADALLAAKYISQCFNLESRRRQQDEFRHKAGYSLDWVNKELVKIDAISVNCQTVSVDHLRTNGRALQAAFIKFAYESGTLGAASEVILSAGVGGTIPEDAIKRLVSDALNGDAHSIETIEIIGSIDPSKVTIDSSQARVIAKALDIAASEDPDNGDLAALRMNFSHFALSKYRELNGNNKIPTPFIGFNEKYPTEYFEGMSDADTGFAKNLSIKLRSTGSDT